MRRLLLVLCLFLFLALPPPCPATAGAVDDPVGVWPLVPQPDVVRRFEAPGSAWGAGHRGVDLSARPGQTVHAALPGRVTFVGRIAGRGVVVVGHGSTRTTYEPVEGTATVGDAVASGAPLGQVEATGSHCLPRTCLHWGWIEGETYRDPLRLVGGGPVRLLPLWRALPVQATAPFPASAWVTLAGALAGRPGAVGPW